MRYVFDNDLHIHSFVSKCSKDPEQTPSAILQYARDNGIKTLVLTDHFWDENVPGASNWYSTQTFSWISQSKPLPKCEGIRFLFGAETEMDKNFRLAITKPRIDELDFLVIPTTHLHMKNLTISEEDAASVERRAQLWIDRLEALLNMDLPFHKIGIAHLACKLIAPSHEEYLQVLDMLPTEKLVELFSKCASLGVGIELNASDMSFSDEEADKVLRMFRIAKSCGCKFYCGSDAHKATSLPKEKAIFDRAIDYLDLTEDDKFYIN